MKVIFIYIHSLMSINFNTEIFLDCLKSICVYLIGELLGDPSVYCVYLVIQVYTVYTWWS